MYRLLIYKPIGFRRPYVAGAVAVRPQRLQAWNLSSDWRCWRCQRDRTRFVSGGAFPGPNWRNSKTSSPRRSRRRPSCEEQSAIRLHCRESWAACTVSGSNLLRSGGCLCRAVPAPPRSSSVDSDRYEFAVLGTLGAYSRSVLADLEIESRPRESVLVLLGADELSLRALVAVLTGNECEVESIRCVAVG